VARGTLEALVENMLKGDVKNIIACVSDLDAAGKDLQRLVMELMELLRHLLVCLHVDDPSSGLDLTDAQVETLRRLAALTDTERILRMARILAETEDRMKFTLSRRTLLETALIRCARAANVASIEEILAKLAALLAGGAEAEPGEPAPPRAHARAASPRPDYTARREPPAPGDELELLRRRWADVAARVNKMAPLARGCLKDAVALGIEGDTVSVGFDPEFSAEIERFKQPRNHRALCKALAEVLHRKVNVSFASQAAAREPAETPPPPSSEAAADEGADACSQTPSAPPPPRTERGSAAAAGRTSKPSARALRDWVKEPAVRETVDLFEGMVTDVRT
jgi:DNA polymerase III gamma/tau subunit